MKKTGVFAVLLIAVLCGTVHADEMSHRQSVLKLLEVANSRQMLDQVAGSINSMLDKQFEALQLTPEGKDAAKMVKKEMSEWFSACFAWEKMRELYVDVYKDVFTEAEVNEMIAFYQSPLGRKMLKKMPELMQVTMEKTQAMLSRNMPEFQKRLQNSIKELELKYNGNNASNRQYELAR